MTGGDCRAGAGVGNISLVGGWRKERGQGRGVGDGNIVEIVRGGSGTTRGRGLQVGHRDWAFDG